MKHILFVIIMSTVFCSCSDHLDIKQDYNYSIQTLPFPKSLKNGETTALEFTIVREAIYEDASYSFRYFQSDGKGVLTDDTGEHYAVNRYYPLRKDVFKMLYRSDCEETQTLDFVFRLDNFGKEVEYSISFQNNSKD